MSKSSPWSQGRKYIYHPEKRKTFKVLSNTKGKYYNGAQYRYSEKRHLQRKRNTKKRTLRAIGTRVYRRTIERRATGSMEATKKKKNKTKKKKKRNARKKQHDIGKRKTCPGDKFAPLG